MVCGIRKSFHLPAMQRYGDAVVSAGVGTICLLMILGTLFASGNTDWFYHPASDALWRGLVAQLIHLDVAHLLANLALLLSLWLAARYLGLAIRLLPVLLFCALMVSVGLRFEHAPLAWYVGLSGALYGLAAWLLLEYVRLASSGTGCLCAYLVFLAMTLKIVLGASPAFLAIQVAHSAHLYGFIAGIMYTLVLPANSDHLRRRMPV